MIIKKYAKKETEKQFRDFDNITIIKDIYNNTPIEPTTNSIKIHYELKHLGYTNIIDSTVDDNIYGVADIETNKYGTTFLNLYEIKHGYSKQVKVKRKWWEEHKCEIGDIIKCSFETKNKRTLVDGEWIESTETEEILKIFAIQE